VTACAYASSVKSREPLNPRFIVESGYGERRISGYIWYNSLVSALLAGPRLLGVAGGPARAHGSPPPPPPKGRQAASGWLSDAENTSHMQYAETAPA
jgi:hypothetical protein